MNSGQCILSERVFCESKEKNQKPKQANKTTKMRNL